MPALPPVAVYSVTAASGSFSLIVLFDGFVRFWCGPLHQAFTLPVPARCWGLNDQGQLGSGATPAQRNSPPVSDVSLPGGTPAVVNAFNKFTCVLYTSGDVTCWVRYCFARRSLLSVRVGHVLF
jgi:hypothetical protein